MSIWTWIGGGAAALVAVVAALYFAGLGGVVKMVGAVTGALGDAAQWLRDWLRRPGNKTRGVCLALAVVSMCLGLQSWQRGTVIIQQRADYTALKERTDREREALVSEREARDRTILQFVKNAEEQMRLLELAKKQSAQYLAEAEAAKLRAAESEAKYQQAFNDKPPECTAALAVMARACPTLQGY